jgi:hypothetical protein
MRSIYPLLVLIFSSGIGYADGGAVQLRASAPPFTVTIFTDPAQLRTGQVDLSALVQAENGAVLDAEVIVSLVALDQEKPVRDTVWVPPACTNISTNLQSIPLRISQGTNRLLYSNLIQIPHEGRWQLQASIQRGPDHASVQGVIEVGPALLPIAAYWHWFLFPFLAIGGFVLHQSIRKQDSGARGAKRRIGVTT